MPTFKFNYKNNDTPLNSLVSPNCEVWGREG